MPHMHQSFPSGDHTPLIRNTLLEDSDNVSRVMKMDQSDMGGAESSEDCSPRKGVPCSLPSLG
jgi:hypothetical protein